MSVLVFLKSQIFLEDLKARILTYVESLAESSDVRWHKIYLSLPQYLSFRSLMPQFRGGTGFYKYIKCSVHVEK